MQCTQCDTTNPEGRATCIDCGAVLPAKQHAGSLLTNTTSHKRLPFYATMGRFQRTGLLVVGVAALCVLFVVVGPWPGIAALFGVLLAQQFWNDNMYPQAAASVLFFVGLGVLLYVERVWPAVLPLLVVALLIGQWSRLRGMLRRAP